MAPRVAAVRFVRQVQARVEPSYLWDELVVVGQMCSAVNAAVGAVAGRQVSLEGLRLGHLHHVSGAGLLAGVRAGTGRVAALLDLLTEETLEDASKSRRCCGVGVWHAPHRHHGRKSNLRISGKRKEMMWWAARSALPIYSARELNCISNINSSFTGAIIWLETSIKWLQSHVVPDQHGCMVM